MSTKAGVVLRGAPLPPDLTPPPKEGELRSRVRIVMGPQLVVAWHNTRPGEEGRWNRLTHLGGLSVGVRRGTQRTGNKVWDR